MKMNNWTVLTKEEMLYVKGGMEIEDPSLLAASDPEAFMDVLRESSQAEIMDWFAEHGYNARRAFRIIRRAARRARRRRRRGC